MITPVNTSEWAVQPGPGEPIEMVLRMVVIIFGATAGALIVVAVAGILDKKRERESGEEKLANE